MDIQVKYRAFVETAKCGSITAAANVLNYTQPGISHIISNLEEDFGFKLFFRGKNGVVLTEEGKWVYEIIEHLLKEQSLLDQAIGQIKGALVGNIRIGGYLSVLIHWFPKLMAAMHEKYPEIEYQILEGNADEQLNLLNKNDIDVGFFSSSAPEDFVFIPLHNDPIVVVMSKGHPLVKYDRIDPKELAQYPFLLKPEHSLGATRTLLLGQSAITSSGFSVRSDNALIALASKGLGIGTVGEMVATTSQEIDYRYLNGDFCRTVGLVLPRWKPVTPALQCFVDTVIELCQDDCFKTK